MSEATNQIELLNDKLLFNEEVKGVVAYDKEVGFIEYSDVYSITNFGRIYGIKAILTELQVLEIRELYKFKKYTQQNLASQFNVSRQTIQAITSNVNWRHI